MRLIDKEISDGVKSATGETIKWMFIFGVGQLATMFGLFYFF
jgi:hypothetical protein